MAHLLSVKPHSLTWAPPFGSGALKPVHAVGPGVAPVIFYIFSFGVVKALVDGLWPIF